MVKRFTELWMHKPGTPDGAIYKVESPMVLATDYAALESDKADLLRVLGVADARVKALEAALREDRADFDAINAMESVYRIDKVLGTASETASKPAAADDLHPGELWSFLRSAMLQGQDIANDYRDKGYEEMSARLDAAAGERVDKLLELLKATV